MDCDEAFKRIKEALNVRDTFVVDDNDYDAIGCICRMVDKLKGR